MHNLIPRHTPTLSVLLDDLCLSPNAAASLLQVSERSICRWLRKDHAPRAVMLSLFFVSRWGLHSTHCVLHNAATMYAGLARSIMQARQMGEPDLYVRALDLERNAANDTPSIDRPAMVGGRDGW